MKPIVHAEQAEPEADRALAPFSPDRWLWAWRTRGVRRAVVGGPGAGTYAALAAAVESARRLIDDHGIPAGSVLAVPVGYSIRAAALLMALAERRCIAVPLSERLSAEAANWRCELAGVGWLTVWGPDGTMGFDRARRDPARPRLIEKLQQAGRPGLVLFTSGSTGEPKGVVHDLGRLLQGFDLREGSAPRILPLLFADHIGGMDTLWRALAGGATLVRPDELSPESVARTVERDAVEVLAASPSQLGFLHAAGVLESGRFDGVRLIVHGAEAMPAALLDRLQRALPHVRFEQRFGTTETGGLRIRVREAGSPWFRVAGDASWDVREGELWIRTASRALGYIHADGSDRFHADDWYRTGDLVETSGDGWLRIVGRVGQVINVGGMKVMPGEVEAVLMQLPQIERCVVSGEPHALAGQVVVADLAWRGPEAGPEVLRRVRRHCQDRLMPAAVPVKVRLGLCSGLNVLKGRVSGAGGDNR